VLCGRRKILKKQKNKFFIKNGSELKQIDTDTSNNGHLNLRVAGSQELRSTLNSQ